MYVANEGKLKAVVPPSDIGEVVADHPGMVTLKSLVGGEPVVSMLAGEQLPRIC